MQFFNISSKLFKSLKSIQEFIYPNACLECGIYLQKISGVCAICIQKFKIIQSDYCQDCGLPFELSVGNDISCASCLRKKPAYHYARAMFIYEDHIKNLILKLKYHDAHYVVPFFAQQMNYYIMAHSIKADFIIPVPSHFRRLLIRQYNPVAIIANKLGQLSRKPVLYQGLKRVKFKTQKGVGKVQREKQMINAFKVSDGSNKIIQDKNILLIDDVYTTGATVQECSRILLNAGAKQVIVLTIARAVLLNNHSKLDF